MPIKYPLRIGTIVWCNYDLGGFTPPEMIKKRLAVVVSPRLPQRDKLATVVPLSTTPPHRDISYQCKIEIEKDLPKPYTSKVVWAKCDMMATVSYSRLDLIRDGRNETTGKRKYLQLFIGDENLNKIRTSLLCSLGLEALTKEEY